jgi:hypothetical protein
MTILIRCRRTAIAFAIGLPFVTVSGQEPRRLAMPDSIPVELATALIAAGGVGGEPMILVGSLPEWFTNRVTVPKNANVLGAATSGSTIVGIYSVGTAVDAAVAELKAASLSRGWTLPPPPTIYGGGGFRPATMAPQAQLASPPNRATVCREDGTLTISGAPARGGGTNVTMRLLSRSGPTMYDTCHPPPRPEPQGYRNPFPTLYDPPVSGEATTANACFPNYNNATGTSTYLRTTLAPDVVLDHYARQLQDSGWAANGPVAAPASRIFTRRDSTGAQIEMTLTVSASPKGPSCRDVTLQVRTPPKP